MKDTKFIILLVFITIVALVNVIWLASLQIKTNQILTLQDEINETSIRQILANRGIHLGAGGEPPLFDGLWIRQQLAILGRDNLPRISFDATTDLTDINVWDANGNSRLDFFDHGPGKKAAITLYSTDGAKIMLSTHGYSPIIQITNKAGKTATYGSP